ncbi:MAG: AAA family ATPase, partial [Helicobacteraceae bacterium]|nr:AAA family ATPase [Helicobacteraceae bacterium]
SSIQIALLSVALLLLIISFVVAATWYAPAIAIAACAIVFFAMRKELRLNAPMAIGNQSSPNANDAGFAPSRSTVTFKDVAGLQIVREELDEIVDYFKNPFKYHQFGIKLPKGILLAGAPGVGKTLIAKAIAGEAGVPFFYVSGSSFVHLYVGVGPKKVSELFARARKSAPSIVFIDEIDAVGKSRGGVRGDERENTLNQLLTEMDGFESGAQVVVLAATNRIEMLDEALLRAGRFDRRIEIALPNASDRLAILKICFANKPHKLDLAKLAANTVGFSGAALSTLANEAAICAVKRGSAAVEDSDVETIREKVISLKKSSEIPNEQTRIALARYQSAKAVVGKRMGLRFESARLTGDFLGREQQMIRSDELFAHICARLAGFALWQVSGEIGTSFCEADINAARELAARYERLFNPANHHANLIEEALAAAIANLDTQSAASLAEQLLANESVPFDIF